MVRFLTVMSISLHWIIFETNSSRCWSQGYDTNHLTFSDSYTGARHETKDNTIYPINSIMETTFLINNQATTNDTFC
jgi:hypothetical protein